MNSVINKLKVINAYRGSKYNLPLNKLIDLDNLNSYEGFLDNKSLNGNMLYFLSKQNPEDRMYLFENLITNEFINDFFNNYNYTPKLNKDNLKWFLLFLNLNNLNSSVVQSFMRFFEDINNFVFKDSFELTEFICNKIYGNSYSYSYISNIFIKLLSVLKNENLNGFDFNEIYEILNNTSDNIDLYDISKESLKIYTDELSVFLPEVTIENYNFCKLIASLCGCEFLNVSRCWIQDTFDYSSKIYSIIEVLNNDEKSFYLKEILNLYHIFYIQNYVSSFDCFLDKIFMKINYGERYSSSRDMLLAGLEVIDKFDSIDNIFDLAKIKSIGSKGLYRKAMDNEKLSNRIAYYSDELKDLSKFINLGSLNEDELNSLISNIHRNNIYSSKLEGLSYQISFKELQLLLDNNLKADIFEYTKDLRLADRIKVITSILSSIKQSNGVYNISDIINIIDVSELLKKHTTFERKDIQTYIDCKLISSKVSFDISSIEELLKLKAYLSLKEDISLLNVPKNSVDEYILSLDYIKDGFNTLDISNSFVLDNKANALEFILNGGFDIALSYHNNYYVKPLQRKNLSLIVKAILAGKYNELKFNFDDISKEIEFNVARNGFDNWVKDDEVSNDIFTIKDTGDFNTIMTIGINPVRTCMNYHGGSYSHCLLSNIDTAKKILTIHKNGVYVGRAILRLTKSSSTGDSSKTLSFIDVETNKHSTSNNNENLVLFVEKMYTSLDSKDLVNVYELMINFLKQKASAIGAELMISHYYNHVAESSGLEVRRKDTYLFITASKNGAQYLDSLDGSTTYSCCYKNSEVLLY